MDLTKLPDIKFCETDASVVEQSVITGYEGVADVTLAPGDPVRLYLEGLAYVIAMQRQIIDRSAKRNLLAYADGNFLDHLGALTDVPRLEAQPARTTLRFELGEVQAGAVTIPEGTRAAASDNLFFATTAPAEIAAGEISVDVPAVCLVPGAAGNGFLPGQINRPVDVVAGVVAVSNSTLTLGGTDIETDDRLRGRVQLSPERYSTAGPRGAYRFHAVSTHQDVADVVEIGPEDAGGEPGKAKLKVLMTGGVLPSQEILDAIKAGLTDEKRRPLTDQVEVTAPDVALFDADVSYTIAESDAALAGAIQEAVSSALDGYVLWQVSKIGRDIDPGELIHRLKGAGALHVTVTSPAYTELSRSQVAQLDSRALTYGGLDVG